MKKYPRSGLFFRSNISETVRGIQVLFSLWPRAIVALPNGANGVSVVHIVSEIWSRQHQNFGMLTCTSERNQYPFEWIRTANKNKNEIYIREAVCDAVREWSEVTRPSADWQTTIFRRFKQLEIIFLKVAERSRDSGRRSHDCRPTVKQRFFEVSSD